LIAREIHDKRDIDHGCCSIFRLQCPKQKIAILHDLCDAPYPTLITLSVSKQNKNEDASIVFGMLQREFSDCLSGELTLEICACEIEAYELKNICGENMRGMEALLANDKAKFFTS
jgi:hypothetical protein